MTHTRIVAITGPSGYTLADLYILWDRLANVPVAELNQGDQSIDALQSPFMHFEVGTPREAVWHWFEAQHPEFVVGEVQQGIRRTGTRRMPS